MNYKIITAENGSNIAEILTDNKKIADVSAGLELLLNMAYESGTNDMIISKEVFIPEFFDLSTTLAGSLFQKLVNYKIRLAIYGDFSEGSKSLADFIRESNKGGNISFSGSLDEAVKRLTGKAV